ncbi:MAG: hypothetical protein ACLU38_11690 [Dysosmobacter sp.]
MPKCHRVQPIDTASGHPLGLHQTRSAIRKTHKQAVLHVYHAVSKENFLLYINRFAQHMVNEYFDNISRRPFLFRLKDAAISNRYYKCTVTGCLLDWLRYFYAVRSGGQYGAALLPIGRRRRTRYSESCLEQQAAKG